MLCARAENSQKEFMIHTRVNEHARVICCRVLRWFLVGLHQQRVCHGL